MHDRTRLAGPAALVHPSHRWLVWLLVASAAAVAVFLLVKEWQARQDIDAARNRLAVLAAALHNEMSRHEALPGILARDPRLAAALNQPMGQRLEEADAYLRYARERSGAEAVFLMDRRGLTLASSNVGEPGSFVGENYAFRPYVIEALEKGAGRFYAVGVTTRRPGYFLAAAVRSESEVLGVVAIKVSLMDFESSLTSGTWPTVVSNEMGVAVLASDERLRYRTLNPLSAAQLGDIRRTRQFPEASLRPMADATRPAATAGSGVAAAPIGHRHRLITQDVGHHGWQVVSFVDAPARATLAAVSAALTFSVAVALALVATAYSLRQERQRELREREEDIRQRIEQGTRQLRQQFEEQARTAAVLRETTDAAVQAGKLAVLGQMSAAISHELNQPLTALRMYSENAVVLLQAGRTDAVTMNLQQISQLADRMGQILGLLRAHLRKQPGCVSQVPVREAIESALALLHTGFDRSGAVEVHVDPPDLKVMAQRIRLEQTILNVVRNALEAQPAERPPCVRANAQGSMVVIEVEDSGPGIPPGHLSQVFEPFFTTKPSGAGLGLGLAVSKMIIQEMGGRIEVRAAAAGGAIFRIELPRVERDEHATGSPVDSGASP